MKGAQFGRILEWLLGALLVLAMLGNAMCLRVGRHKEKQEVKSPGSLSWQIINDILSKARGEEAK